MKKKQRIDTLLVQYGFFASRERAKRAVMAGQVSIKGYPSIKPGQLVSEHTAFIIHETDRYASRGGDKLEGAVNAFDLCVKDAIALDIGASTGGFTDCLLQYGAQKVYAVDVGKSLLAESLCTDPRVIQIDKSNARYMQADDIPELVDIITMDVSFISIKKIIPVVIQFLKPGGMLLPLVKPQFEVGKENVGRKGVVRDKKLISNLLQDMIKFCHSLSLDVYGQVRSPITGPAGNREYLLWVVKV